MKKRNIFFWIGTEAELIKVFPVIIECQKKNAICHIIATGQNDLTKSRILQLIQLNGKMVTLSNESEIKKNAIGLLRWFMKVLHNSGKLILKYFNESELKNQCMVVHGDTVSTFMGALVGRKMHMTVCHVEAGLRSHNLLNPFPEEIDRLLTSRIARIHFAPGQDPAKNLKHAKGKIIDTKYNTILDSLAESKKLVVQTQAVNDLLNDQYFVFVMHRQENLMNKNFFSDVLKQIRVISKQKKCVLILHKITEKKLIEMNEMKSLENDSNFVLLPRVDYFDFMKLLDYSQFVITDGGSNQEELHYMGKPCMIMRKTTERNEGIGYNAILYNGKVSSINQFADNYLKYRIDSLTNREHPSELIACTLCENQSI